jgi:hypothetical protein
MGGTVTDQPKKRKKRGVSNAHRDAGAGGVWVEVPLKATDPDPLTGFTDEEISALAEEGYEQRDDRAAWEEIDPPEFAPDVRSVVSVRFSRGELGPVEKAAKQAGVPVSTYIRNVALAAASEPDLDRRRRVFLAYQRLEKDLKIVKDHLDPYALPAIPRPLSAAARERRKAVTRMRRRKVENK